MKFDRIVGFGDSWMWGDELLDPKLASLPNAHPILDSNTPYREAHCFLGLLGQYYDVPVQNFGIPGGSLQSSIWCYLWWLNHCTATNALVVVAHTDAGRQTFFNPNHVPYPNDPPWNKFVHSSWAQAGSSTVSTEWNDMIKRNLVLTSCRDLEKLNYQQTVLFFQGQHGHNQNCVLQFCVAIPPMVVNAPTLIDPTLSVNGQMISRNFRKSGGHPNEQGHEIIRDYLISHINSATING